MYLALLALISLLNGRLTECEGEYCCPEMKGIVSKNSLRRRLSGDGSERRTKKQFRHISVQGVQVRELYRLPFLKA